MPNLYSLKDYFINEGSSPEFTTTIIEAISSELPFRDLKNPIMVVVFSEFPKFVDVKFCFDKKDAEGYLADTIEDGRVSLGFKVFNNDMFVLVI